VSRGPSVTAELLVYIMCCSTSARVDVTAVIHANQFMCIRANCLRKCHITLSWVTITTEYLEVYLSGCSTFLFCRGTASVESAANRVETVNRQHCSSACL